MAHNYALRFASEKLDAWSKLTVQIKDADDETRPILSAGFLDNVKQLEEFLEEMKSAEQFDCLIAKRGKGKPKATTSRTGRGRVIKRAVFGDAELDKFVHVRLHTLKGILVKWSK